MKQPTPHRPLQWPALATALADAIIRILDIGEAFNVRAPESMFAKMEYNNSRTFRHGGKLA